MTKAELAKRGVNFDNMNYPCGELNIIVMQMIHLIVDLLLDKETITKSL